MDSILARPASRDDGQLGARLDRLPFLGVELPDDARLGALELVLHLHCLDDDEALPFRDGIPFFDQHPDDLSGHGRVDPLRAFEGELPARLVHAVFAVVEQVEGVDLVAEEHAKAALCIALDVAAPAATSRAMQRAAFACSSATRSTPSTCSTTANTACTRRAGSSPSKARSGSTRPCPERSSGCWSKKGIPSRKGKASSSSRQ